MKKSKLNYRLAMAAAEGRAAACRVLLGKGADPAKRDGNGYTPLCHAILNGHSRCVFVLRDCGIEFNLERGEHPTSLELAAQGGNAEILVLVLFALVEGGDFLDRDILADAIAAAAKHNQPAALRILMQLPGDPCVAREGSTETPVHTVLKSGHLECAKVLAEAAEKNKRIDHVLLNTGPVLPINGVKGWAEHERRQRENDGLLRRLEHFRVLCNQSSASLSAHGSWHDSEMIDRYLLAAPEIDNS